MYFGIIELYNNELLMKYGISSDLFRSKEHKNTFGEQLKIIDVWKTDNNKKYRKRNEGSIIMCISVIQRKKKREELFDI